MWGADWTGEQRNRMGRRYWTARCRGCRNNSELKFFPIGRTREGTFTFKLDSSSSVLCVTRKHFIYISRLVLRQSDCQNYKFYCVPIITDCALWTRCRQLSSIP